MKFLYGNSWEKYPIQSGDVWDETVTGSKLAVADIRQGIPDFMNQAQLLYCDPPWDLGNANSFITKAEKPSYINTFNEFIAPLFTRITEIGPSVCYLEMGKRNLALTLSKLSNLFSVIQVWEILYYKKHSCYLIRGGSDHQTFDFSGLDDSETPSAVLSNEQPLPVGDLCTGRGLTALAAFQHRRPFFGTELNQRRLAVTIDRVNKAGGCYACSVSEKYFPGIST